MTTNPPPDANQDPDRRIDELGRRAGADLRRDPPADGPARLEAGAKAHTRRRMALVGVGSAVLIAALVGFATTRNDKATEPVVGDLTEDLATDSTPALSSAAPATTVAATTVPDGAVATTTGSTTTVAPTIDPAVQWAIDFTGGSAGKATGEPLRIGFANNDSAYIDGSIGMQSAVGLINNELGGIGGRPIEIVACLPEQTADAIACARQLRDDPTISTVIVGQLDPLEFYTELGSTKFALSFAPNGTIIDDSTTGGLPSVYSIYQSGAIWLQRAYEIVGNATIAPVRRLAVIDSIGGFYGRDVVAPNLPGVEVVPIGVPAFGSAQEVADAIQAAEALDVDMVWPIGEFPSCASLPEALEILGVEPLVLVSEFCSFDIAMEQRLAERGVGGDAPEGWYVLSYGYNEKHHTLESGWDTYIAKFMQYAQIPQDHVVQRSAEAMITYGNMLIAARVLNEVGVDGTNAELRTALEAFEGPAPFQQGPVHCGRMPRVASTFAGDCYSSASVLQYVGGQWVGLDGTSVPTLFDEPPA